MKGQSKTMDNRECACTRDYKSTEEEILLHHVLIKLRYLKDGRETVVLKFLTTTEVPCKGWQVQVTVSRRITPVLKQELQPFTLNNSMVLFPEICHTKNTFLDFFYLSCGKKLVLFTKGPNLYLGNFLPTDTISNGVCWSR